MKEVAKFLQTVFSGYQPLVDEVGEKFYWELGREDDPVPVITYTIRDIGGRNKDVKSYEVGIRCYHETMDQTADLQLLVEEALKGESRARYVGAESGVTEPPESEGFIELTYNIKL